MTATRIHLAVAGLMGAWGVALLAAARHVAGGEMATIAAQMLLFHAPALVAWALARKSGLTHDLLARLAITGLALGVILFAGDLAIRGLGGDRLFAYAAPLGGSLTIVSWLVLAVAALIGVRPRG